MLSLKAVLFSKPEKNNSNYESIETGFTLHKKKLLQNEYLKGINKSEQFDYLLNHKNRFNNKRDIEIFNRLPQGANSLHESIVDIMPYKSRNHMFKDKYYKLKMNEVCKTITSHMKLDCNMYIHPKQARGLSPREAARIQSFPDSFYFRGPQNKWYAHFRPIQANAPALAAYSMAIAQQAAAAFGHVYNGYFLIKSLLCV